MDSNRNYGTQSYDGGLKIYDISNPILPEFISIINPDPAKTLRSMCRKGNYIYISGNSISQFDAYEIWVVDISLPTNPIIIDSYQSTERYYDLDLRIEGDLLFTSDRNIFDISDPSAIELIESSNYLDYQALGIDIYENYFYEARINSVNIYCFEDIVSTTNEISMLPSSIMNYPNPFNPSTTITFELTSEIAEHTELVIYNIKGQKVKNLYQHLNYPELSEGRENTKYSIVWNGTNDSGKPVASGIYLCTLKIMDTIIASRKMMLLR